METTTDKILVKKYVETADIKAFEKIYNKYFDPIYNFVFSRVGNQTWTEDIVSETFITFSQIIKSFNGKSKLQSFIIGIAINKTKQFWAKSHIEKEAEFDETKIILDEEEVDLEKEKKLKITINKILPKLKKNYRDVLIERFINCQSIKETAAELNLTEANVRVLQNRALKKAALLANEYFKNLNKKES